MLLASASAVSLSSSAVFGSIPSPSFNTVGPFTLYGLMLGLGIVAATLLARPRLAARSVHPDTAVEMLTWCVPAGIVGARLYHVITDWKPIGDWVKIWEGGLGVPGAIAGGAVGALLFLRRRELPIPRVADAIAPALPLAQAIGRLGNWWNQELYGRPTDLPWGLEIDESHRLNGYEGFETFHPAFLYEMLWNLGLCAALVWVDRTGRLKPGKLIWVYTGGYAIGRLWIEALRIDPANDIFGFRVNHVLMTVILAASIFLLRNAFRGPGDDAAGDAGDVAGDDAAGDAGDVAGDDAAGEAGDVAGGDAAGDAGDVAGDDAAGDDAAGEAGDVAGEDAAGDDAARDVESAVDRSQESAASPADGLGDDEAE